MYKQLSFEVSSFINNCRLTYKQLLPLKYKQLSFDVYLNN